MKVLLPAVACIATLVVSAQSHAQSWPNRPIKLVVPTGPGAATDVIARLVSDSLSRSIGQPVIVENMPGASGIVAHQSVSRAPPDGYTLLFTNTSGMAVNPISFKQLPYDPMRDFAAVAMVCSLGPQMLSVNAGIPVATVPEFLDYAKANSGKLSMAFDTTAGAAAFAAKLLNKRAGLNLIEVPYRSAPQMAQDMAAGINQVMVSSIVAAQPVMEGGKVRRLAVTSEKRFPGMAALPTVSETVPGVVMNGWFAIVAPAGTPPGVISRLNQEIGRYLQSADVQQRLLSFGVATEGAGTPESTAQFIATDQAHWQALAKELDVQAQ